MNKFKVGDHVVIVQKSKDPDGLHSRSGQRIGKTGVITTIAPDDSRQPYKIAWDEVAEEEFWWAYYDEVECSSIVKSPLWQALL